MLLAAVMALPCVYWLQGPETTPAVKAAGIERLCVPEEAAQSWRDSGIAVTAITASELRAREVLPAPGLLVQPELASATRSPWVTANGWRFIRNPGGRYLYDLPAGTGLLAASEALAYGADALLKIDAADLSAVGRFLAQFTALPERDLPNAADIGVVDDNSAEAGELMNLLVQEKPPVSTRRSADSARPLLRRRPTRHAGLHPKGSGRSERARAQDPPAAYRRPAHAQDLWQRGRDCPVHRGRHAGAPAPRELRRSHPRRPARAPPRRVSHQSGLGGGVRQRGSDRRDGVRRGHRVLVAVSRALRGRGSRSGR